VYGTQDDHFVWEEDESIFSEDDEERKNEQTDGHLALAWPTLDTRVFPFALSLVSAHFVCFIVGVKLLPFLDITEVVVEIKHLAAAISETKTHRHMGRES